MQIPDKQLKSGFKLPVVGLGTWQMGGRLEPDPDNDDQADIMAIKKALESGITHIDTAEVYADGQSEKIVGRAIKDFDRSKIFLTSKAKLDNLKYNDILKACEGSLSRLGTDYLDLYLLHRFNQDVPLEESIKALDKLVEEGLVKNIGVCNFGVRHLQEAQALSANQLVCDQVHYNLKYREPEKELLQYCQENDLFLSAWRPLEKGAILSESGILTELCDKYGKTPSQIAINWLICQTNVITLFKTSNLSHLEENLGAVGWQMSVEDMARLRKEFPDQKMISDTIPLSC
jgi:diketogulonate reductase-like aldo/keto reductase